MRRTASQAGQRRRASWVPSSKTEQAPKKAAFGIVGGLAGLVDADEQRRDDRVSVLIHRENGAAAIALASPALAKTTIPGGEKACKAEIAKLSPAPKSARVDKEGAKATNASFVFDVKVWNADALNATKTLTGLTDFVYATAFSPDGTKVAAGSFAGEVCVWDAKDKNDKPVVQFNATPGLKKQ